MPSFNAAPNTTPLSGGMRLLAGLLLLACALGAGVLQRAPLIIAVLTLTFSAAFVIGRLAGWRHLRAHGRFKQIVMAVLSVVLVQAVLVGVLYLLGVGGAVVLGRGGGFQPFAAIDVWLPLAIGLASALLGLAVYRLEHASPRSAEAFDALAQETGKASPDAEIRLLPEPLTPQTFYSGIHFSHASRSDTGEYDGTPNAKSAGSEDRIRAAEARLGVTLPEGLRALYRVQNGGHVPGLGIVRDGGRTATLYDQLVMPFGGYDDLYPAESLTTAHESFLAFADPEDEDVYGYLFRNGTDRMVVLAQWYRQSLFLDYSQPGEPSVGFVDFDDEDWAERIERWPDFATFFAALRRFEDL